MFPALGPLGGVRPPEGPKPHPTEAGRPPPPLPRMHDNGASAHPPGSLPGLEDLAALPETGLAEELPPEVCSRWIQAT